MLIFFHQQMPHFQERRDQGNAVKEQARNLASEFPVVWIFRIRKARRIDNLSRT